MGRAPPVGFLGARGEQLAPPAHQRGEFLGAGIRQGAWRWLEGLAILRQDQRIQAVGLGQLARRLGEVPGLARVDQHDRQLRGGQLGHDQPLVATGGFHDDDRRRVGQQRVHQLGDTRAAVGHLPVLLRGQAGHLDGGFGDIQPDHRRVCLHQISSLVRSTDGAIGSRPCRCELIRLQ